MKILLEVCVETVKSAAAAERGGADRVELCTNRVVGGTTPPVAEVVHACRSLTIPVHVLIRPRAGDFVASRGEFERMRTEALSAKEAGASGVVLGVLLPDHRIDRERTAALADLARPLSVTFHKAFDETPDPFAALDVLKALGIDRLLTSGQAATARAGLNCLAALTRIAAGRIVVMAGGALTFEDVPAVIAAGLEEVHVGSCVAEAGETRADLVAGLVTRLRRGGGPLIGFV